MCGIIGIIGSNNLAEELYAGLLGLQHRGQDFAGIQSYNPDHPISESGISSEITAGLVDNLSSRARGFRTVDSLNSWIIALCKERGTIKCRGKYQQN